MSMVFYAINGEGRGHATRATSLIEALRRRDHEVVVYTYGQALDLLRARYAGSEVQVRTVPAIHWRYRSDETVDLARTVGSGLKHYAGLDRLAREYARDIERDAPALLVTDFEATLPRAARLVGLPFVVFDHQHYIVTADLSALPLRLRAFVGAMTPFVALWCTRSASEVIVSSFFDPGVRRGLARASHVGVMLRDEVLEARPTVGRHLVGYFRRHVPAAVLQALSTCGVEVRVYGPPVRERVGDVVFRPVSLDGFLEDLATSRGLVCTAGNQLIGEALHLRKPVLAMPEPNNVEQEINAWYIGRSAWGMTTTTTTVTAATVRAFLDREDVLREATARALPAGNTAALERIEARLPVRLRTGAAHAASRVPGPRDLAQPHAQARPA